MKKILLPAIAIITLAFSACSDDDNNNTNCDETVAAIAGNYKLTKLTKIFNGSSEDVSSRITGCAQTTTYALNSNKSYAATSPGGDCNYSGTWDIVNGIFVAEGSQMTGTVDNRCSYITLTNSVNDTAFVATFTRQ